MKKIMFVCTGNICRSAMAHVLLEHKAQEKGKEIEVSSCGTFAADGDMSTINAIEVMKEDYNIDLSKHRSTNIRNANILEQDLILCATRNHKMMVLQMFPELVGKVFTMKEYANDEQTNDIDISDPWGNSKETYRKCAKEISDITDKIIDKI